MGARPVFVDIDPLTYTMDVEAVAEVMAGAATGARAALGAPTPTGRVRALIPVHLFGQMADMERLMAAARDGVAAGATVAGEAAVAVIEDAAQAIGAERDGRRAGSVGDCGCFSFFPSKNLGAFGDAGAITCQNAAPAERIDMLRQHGARPKYHHVLVGGNFRLDALQAAVLQVKLRQLDVWTEGRRRNAEQYRALFTEAGLAGGPAGTEGPAGLSSYPVVLPYEVPGSRHIYNQFVLRVRHRDALRAHLQAEGIGCEVYYPEPLHLQPCFAHLGYRRGDFPQAEAAARETLAIPVYPELSTAQQERVVEEIRTFYRKAGAARDL